MAVMSVLDRAHTVAPHSLQPVAHPPGRPRGPPLHRPGVRHERLQELDGRALRRLADRDRLRVLDRDRDARAVGARSSAPGSTRSARARRCSPRPAAGPPGFLVGAAGIATEQLWLLYLGYGVIGGIGLGIGYISPVSTLIKWFPDRPGPGHRHGDHGLRRRRDGGRARRRASCWASTTRPTTRPTRPRWPTGARSPVLFVTPRGSSTS